jgi:hypothetical protein
MNNLDEFERKLERQPQRQLPRSWRAEILSAAREAAVARPARRSVWSTINHLFSTLLWPRPEAWAGLAAAWLLVLGLNVAAREPAREASPRETRPVAQMRDLWRQHEQMLAELVGLPEKPEMPHRRTPPPTPRSQRREDFMHA